MVCFKIVFLALPVRFQSFLLCALEIIFIMVVWLIVNPCVLLNVSPFCHALCFLCLFSNLLSGCKKTLPSQIVCLPSICKVHCPIQLCCLKNVICFFSMLFLLCVVLIFTCLPFAEFGFQTTYPCCQDATFKFLCLILEITATILFLIVLFFIPSFCLLFCKACFASCSVASCSVLLFLSFS